MIRICRINENEYKYSDIVSKCIIWLWTIEEVRPYCYMWFLNDSWMILSDCNWFLSNSLWFSNNSWVILSDSQIILEWFSSDSCWFSNDSLMVLKWFSAILEWFVNNSRMIHKWFSNNFWMILQWFLVTFKWFSNNPQVFLSNSWVICKQF